MKTHKRTKNTRIRGSRTAGWGFRQSHKGHGNKGGVGMAGSGKRGDHDKQRALESDKKGGYFGKKGLTSRGSVRKKSSQKNLLDIKENIFKKVGEKIDLSKYKILGFGEGFKAEITAKSASNTAIEKMKKAGGKIILLSKKADEKADEKVEKKAEKKAEKKVEKKTEKKVEKKTEKKAEKKVE